MHTCKVDKCNRPVRAKEYCSAHYTRHHKHGNPLSDTPITQYKRQIKWEMGKCKNCHKYTQVNNVDTMCQTCRHQIEKNTNQPVHLNKSTFAPAAKIIGFTMRDDWLIPGNGNGEILSRQAWVDIRNQADAFYTYASDAEINEYNSGLFARVNSGQPNVRKSVKGFVYLLRAENGAYKIGRTLDMSGRLNSIQKEYPIEIKLLHFFECLDYKDAELALHEMYSKYRLGSTEWFELPNECVNEICAMDNFVTELSFASQESDN